MGHAERQQAHLAALSGLLHDIGKFWQRTDNLKVHQDYGKVDYGTSGAHATFSAAFVNEFVPEPWRAAILSGVLFHHRPADEGARLVALANHLSAAVDRTGPAENDPKQMLSVFANLGGAAGSRLVTPLSPLELRQGALFPAPALSDADARAAYARLWSGFAADAKSLASAAQGSLEAYVEGLLSLMQQYTWCVPSAYYGGEADISLYDHSRTTAALAAVLAQVGDQRIAALLKQNDGTPVATFIEGDVSGIQKFIYTVPARGAAKQLRARSFYLQMLAFGVARRLLAEFDMPATNLIYAGGGRFFILVPYQADKSADSALGQVRAAVDHMLLRHHDGDLNISLGWADLTTGDFTNPARFSEKWREVTAATGRAKRQRYAHLPAHMLMDEVFAPRQQHEGELALRRADRDEVGDASEDSDAASALARSFKDLAKELARADYLALEFFPPQQKAPGTLNDALHELGMRLYPVSSDTLGHGWKSPDPHPNVDYVLVQGLQSAPTQGDLKQIAGRWKCPVVGSLRWTVNVTAEVNQHRPATFDELQKAAGQAGAIRRLGVLRMDVDNLGELFSSGFSTADKSGKQTSRDSLARKASLSFSLGLFFEGWVGELCRLMNKKHVVEIETDDEGHFSRIEAIYAVYSGGDDLFIVGRWDVLPELAQQIRDDFRAYGCANPKISISAGITLHAGKYPLYQAAEEAGDALDMAKALPGKDAIAFLGQAFKWDKWGKVVQDREHLGALVGKGAARAVLQTLQQLHAEYLEARKQAKTNGAGEAQIPWGPYQWRAAYQFARLAERSRGHEDDVRVLHDRLKQTHFEAILELGLAARWVEALTRSERKD